jgi:hypothetical protein
MIQRCDCGKLAVSFAMVTTGTSVVAIYMCNKCEESEKEYGTEIMPLNQEDAKKGLADILYDALKKKRMTVKMMATTFNKHPGTIRRIVQNDKRFAIIKTQRRKGAGGEELNVWGIRVD